MDSEEANNFMKNTMDDTEDLLGSSGIDDEGIVNFLSDAIGQDVGTEVLREFSHSDAFAELLDVVTSSLIPRSGATSRRESHQDSEAADGEPDPFQCDESKRLDASSITKEQNIVSSALENKTKDIIFQNRTEDQELPDEDVVIPEENPLNCKTLEKIDENIPSDIGRKIQNRLKICMKTSVGVKKGKISKKNKTSRKTTEIKTLNPEPNDTGNKPKNPEKQTNVSKIDKIKKTEFKCNQRLHKKCLLLHNDEEFKKYSATLKLDPCCVILCDLLNMGSAFRETNCLGGGGDASLSFVSVKNVVVMDEPKIDQTLEVEKRKRRYLAKKLFVRSPVSPVTKNKIMDQPHSKIILSDDENVNKRNVTHQVSFKSSDKKDVEITKIQGKQEVPATANRNEDQAVMYDELRKNKYSTIEIEVEDDDEELRHPKVRNKSEERHGRGLEVEATSSNENESKDNNQQFGRRRDKDDVRARKFDKFEYERKRKFTENKGEKVKKEVKPVFKPQQDPFRQVKTLSNSFKIPKKNTYDNYVNPEDLKVSTPLAKQEIPSENLKFEKFKKGKGDEKDSNIQKRDWIPRNKRYETRPKINFEVPDSNKPLVPPLEMKAEIEPTWEDEPEGGGSIFGDRSTDSPLPPLSEVLAGDLAVEVTELLRDGLKVEILSMEDFSCATDTTAQKCAWWFSKSDQEPPSEGDCQMQNLEDAPSCCSENGSNISFVGNISNTGTEADCQVNEISSTNWGDVVGSESVRDPDKVDEYCGRSLLQAKIRICASEKFQNIFDLRSGALYEKENFQAKCNLCNQLIVGKRELAVHVRGATHKINLRKIDPQMGRSEEVLSVTSAKESENVKEADCDDKVIDNMKKVKKEMKDRDQNDAGDGKNGKDRKGDKNHKEKEEKNKDGKDKKNKKSQETSPKKNGKKENDKGAEPAPVKKEPVEMVYERTSSGLEIKVPVTESSKLRSKSPLNRRVESSRSRSRNRSRSRSRDRRRRRSRSPIRRIPRSPTQYPRNTRRSRTRSPARGSRKRRTSSEEKVKAFLARTRRSRSPTNGYHSKRNRRSRTRSRSPQIAMKKDNREFHEKLALTADGKWNDEMEKRWKLMEADEAMFREQFYDRRKALISAPEEHPKYAMEWTQFWERRYQEVEQSGKDPDSYDYVTEWKEYWNKRLNTLLQEEADAKILAIKMKHGMDFASLSKLRISESTTFVKTEPAIPPLSNPPIVKRETIVSVATPASLSDRASLEDFATRSMSISDGDIETGKNKSVKQPERKPSVTCEDFKSQWLLLTQKKVDQELTSSLTDGLVIAPARQEVPKRKHPDSENDQASGSKRHQSKSRSDIASSSEASYDFDGFDLVQVLRLMCQLEDQLSFLAPKVVEYFKMAEEMELAKSRGSHTLLDNEELVTVLFQSRDRFMTMIRSNILSKDVLKSLNLTVYALNAILDAPQCQKFRLQVPIALPSLETPVSIVEVKKEIKEPDASPIKIVKEEVKELDIKDLSVDYDSDIVDAMVNVPFDTKKTIAAMLAKYLVAHGRENIGDKSLKEFLRKMLDGFIKHHSDHRNLEPCTSSGHRSDIRRNAGVKLNFNTEQDTHIVPNTVGNFDSQSHSASSRLYGVASSRVVGTALPNLSSVSVRAVERVQPVRGAPPFIEHHSIDAYRTTRESQRSPTSSGRRSPFSRRDYTGNPVANQRR